MERLSYTRRTLKGLAKLPRAVRARLQRELVAVAADPLHYRGDWKRLRGSPYWRLRVGRYRAICALQEGEIRLLVLKIEPQRGCIQMSVQIIEKDGKPEYAVVPYEEWRRLQRLAEEVADIRAADAAMRALEAGEEALIPAAVADALLDGTPPLRAWRKYRGYTQRELAQMAGVSQGAIAQIESGRRRGSIRLLTRLARALDIEIADLLMED